MVKYMENMAAVALAAYDVAGTPHQWTLTRERDVESLELIWANGAITTTNAADQKADPFWGLTFFQIAYDDKIIRLPGQHFAAYNYFFYPDDPASVGGQAWADNPTVTNLANTWHARCRIACHIPAKAGASITCTASQSGEAVWTEAAANMAIAAGTMYVIPRYGSFTEKLSANYMVTVNVAADTTFLPGTTGQKYVGSIIGAYCDITAFAASAIVSSASRTLAVNTYSADNVTSLLVDVAGDTLIQLPNAVQSEWPFQRGQMIRKMNCSDVTTVPLEQGCMIALPELIIDGGIEMPAGSAVRYMVNAVGTPDIIITTIFGDPCEIENTGGRPVQDVQQGPGGTATARPGLSYNVIPQKTQTPMGGGQRHFRR